MTMIRTSPHARRRLARLTAGSATLLALALVTPHAVAEVISDGPPEPGFEVTEEVLSDSITRFDAAESITRFDATESITSLGGTDTDTEEDVIVLETDILFASNAWDLPAPAASKIVELAAEVPEGATVQVGGHTDSRPVDRSQYDFDNQQLSEHRAQAVADALAAERPDLTLEVEGFGDEQPAVSEDPDDPSTYAANRRVELRYGG